MRDLTCAGGAPAGAHGPGETHGGLTLHRPGGWHPYAATAMSGLMWFWIFLRCKEDGSTLLYGHAQHFEHDHGDDHH